MDLTSATAFVTLRGALDQEPVITSGELTQLLEELAVTDDADGNAPTDSGWAETYSRLGCYRVLTELWDLKAGRIAHRFDFLAPTSGGLFKLSQVYDHCVAEAAKYRRYVNESVRNAE